MLLGGTKKTLKFRADPPMTMARSVYAMSSISGISGIQQVIEVAVLAKQLEDAQEIEGEGVLQLLEQSAEVLGELAKGVDPNLGRLLDTYL